MKNDFWIILILPIFLIANTFMIAPGGIISLIKEMTLGQNILMVLVIITGNVIIYGPVLAR